MSANLSKWKKTNRKGGDEIFKLISVSNLPFRSHWSMREKSISEFNSKVVFTGNGGDEIFDNYPSLPAVFQKHPLKYNGITSKNPDGFGICSYKC